MLSKERHQTATRPKSTFSLVLANKLAKKVIQEPASRIPVRIPLGELVHENSLEGLFGKFFTEHQIVENYNWPVFRMLNRMGHFLIVLDGFDEMKHGMTFPNFNSQFNRLLELAEDNAKVLILGRDTAFADEWEFRTIIDGVSQTPNGTIVKSHERPECQHTKIAPFSRDEAREFIVSYFTLLVKRDGISTKDQRVAERTSLLNSGKFDALLGKPVHAQMLCRIASDFQFDLEGLTEFRLYDQFVHYLLDREIKKIGRYPGFGIDIRRKANAGLSWWMLSQGGASTTTIADAPSSVFKAAVGDAQHSFDSAGLVRELSQGCLIEKGLGTIYFGHRSIQEFLAAEHLFATEYLSGGFSSLEGAASVLKYTTPEMVDFLSEFFENSPERKRKAGRVLGQFAPFAGVVAIDKLAPYLVPLKHSPESVLQYKASPVLITLDFVDKFGVCGGLKTGNSKFLFDKILKEKLPLV